MAKWAKVLQEQYIFVTRKEKMYVHTPETTKTKEIWVCEATCRFCGWKIVVTGESKVTANSYKLVMVRDHKCPSYIK